MSECKIYARNAVLIFAALGIFDFILQQITGGEFKLIHTILGVFVS